MNNLLQNAIMGMNLQDINSELPSGIIEIKEGYLMSQPIPGATDCYISGRFDILTRLEDDTYTVIDFKITNPTEEQIQKFSSQLHAYKFALENPASGKPIKVSKLGLVSISPQSVELVDGKVLFTTVPKWHPIKEDMDSFYSLVKKISTLLAGDLPPVSSTCSLCVYREKFEPKNKVIQDEIPF